MTSECCAVNIIFDGPPGPEGGRFVEVENDDGKSINYGEWRELEGGCWALRIEKSCFDVPTFRYPCDVCGAFFTSHVPPALMRNARCLSCRNKAYKEECDEKVLRDDG